MVVPSQSLALLGRGLVVTRSRRCIPARLPWLGMLALLVGAGLLPRAAAAQDGPGAPFCVAVTPDAKAVNRTVGAQSDTFSVWNCGTSNDTYDLTCTATGTIACTGLSQTTVALTAGATTTILASYSASAGSGGLTLTAEGWAEATSDSGWYSITAGAPLVDATPWHPALQSYARCAQSCFAATYVQGTVSYVSLDAPRNVVLVYNGDRSDAKPFVHVNVTPDPGTAPPSEYQLKVKVNGAFVTFLNGEQTLRFSYPGTAPHRLGGQFTAASYGTGAYLMEIHVAGLYGAALRTAVVAAQFVAVDTTYQIARGWRLGGIQRLYANGDGSRLVVEGDGSAVLFAAGSLAAPAGEFSVLRIGTPSGGGGWTRAYPDSTKVVFNTAGRMIEVRDRWNNIATVTYDASNRVSQIKDPLNLAITLTYNANGLATITDPMGRVTTVTVDGSKKLTQIRDPDNVSTTFGYDASRRLLTITNRRGHATTLAYDAQSGKLWSVTAPADTLAGTNGADSLLAPVTTLAAWQKVGVPYGPTTTPVPPAKADTIKGSVTEPGEAVTRFTVNRWGQPLATTDPLAQVTTRTYDANGLPIRVVWPSGRVDTTAYNASGLPTYGRSSPDSATHLRYAAWAQPDSVWGVGHPTVRHVIGPNGRIVSTTVGGSSTTQFWYDTRGRVDSTRDALGHLVRRTWYLGVNENHSKDSLPGGRVTTYLYDGFGRDTAVQLPGTPTRRTHYDPLNRPTELYDGVNANPTVIVYDSLFPRSATDSKGQLYRFTFNKLGWMTERLDPAGRADRYRYDRVGNLRNWLNRRGDSLHYAYDVLNRRTTKSGTNTTSESWTYSTNGLVIASTSPVSTETVYFNVAGRADSVKTVVASQIYWRRDRYTSAGLLDSVDITGGGIAFRARKYVHNTGLGTLTAIRLAGASTGIVTNADVQDTSVAFPGGDQLSRQYYPLHSLTQLSTSAAYNLTIARSVGFDVRGRISLHVVGDGANGHRYAYDGLGRLLSDSTVNNPAPPASCDGNPPPVIDANGNSCVNAGGWVAVSGLQFAYDAAGNRTDKGGTYLTGNRISAFDGCTYTTDYDGNVSSRTCGTELVTAGWSAESRLTSVTIGTQTVAFKYDALGRLVRKDLDGTPQSYFLWDGFNLLAELNSTGTAAVAEYSYYPGLDSLHAVILGGQQYNAHTDALGNVVALTDGGQTVKRTYEYDAWGRLTGGSDLQPFSNADRARWKGALWLGPEIDLYYMRNRWYEPRSGRFLSEDPEHLAALARAPQSQFLWNGVNLHGELTQAGTGEEVGRYPDYPWTHRSPAPSIGQVPSCVNVEGLYAWADPIDGRDPAGLGRCEELFERLSRRCRLLRSPKLRALCWAAAGAAYGACRAEEWIRRRRGRGGPGGGGGGGSGGGGGGGGGGSGCGMYDVYVDGVYVGTFEVCLDQ